MLTERRSSKDGQGTEGANREKADEENRQTPKQHRPVGLTCLPDGDVPHIPLHCSGSEDEKHNGDKRQRDTDDPIHSVNIPQGRRSVSAPVARNLSLPERRVAAGEEIVIARRGTPIARIVPLTPSDTRQLGIDEGRVTVPDDFNQPIEDNGKEPIT